MRTIATPSHSSSKGVLVSRLAPALMSGAAMFAFPSGASAQNGPDQDLGFLRFYTQAALETARLVPGRTDNSRILRFAEREIRAEAAAFRALDLAERRDGMFVREATGEQNLAADTPATAMALSGLAHASGTDFDLGFRNVEYSNLRALANRYQIVARLGPQSLHAFAEAQERRVRDALADLANL